MRRTKRPLLPRLACLMLALFLMPLAAFAEGGGKVVRVGWYESPFNMTDRHGRRSGYAYEYQRKIAAYTGWTYEYVDASWPDLMRMLEDGEIDLMSDVSYTEARAENMLFPELPMGSEDYYLFIDRDNTEIVPDDYSPLNGKRVGIYRGSVQNDYFNNWAAAHDVHAEVVELTCSVDEALQMLADGQIDVYILLDYYADPETTTPVCEIGASDFYFAVNKDRPDLLNELNTALSRIRSEDKYYNQEMYEKYNKTSNANLSLSPREASWLKNHDPIRVGYQEDYLAFCATDANGELTGALKDYLALASRSLANAPLAFEPVAYPTKAAVVAALQSGEVDCVFPANLTDSDAEDMGAIITPPVMTTEVYAVVRQAEQQTFVVKQDLNAAVDQNNTIFDMFLSDHFPGMRVTYFPDTQSCLQAVANKTVDCLMISNYRFSSLSRLCDKLRLTTVPTGVDLSYGFALRQGETDLYAILTRVTQLVPASNINAALNYYSTADARFGLLGYLKEHLAVAASAVAGVLLVILVLVLKSLHAERKANAGQQLIDAVERDPLTGLYNKNFFYEYANRYFHERPDVPADAIALNLEQFHALNELHGRAFGDQVLRALGQAISDFIAPSVGIAGRFEDDNFGIFCTPQADYAAVLKNFQSRLDRFAEDTNIRLRMGVMQYHPGMEPVLIYDHARTACAKVRGTEKHLMVFDQEMQARENLDQRLLNDLGRALREHEFEVYYQPKYDIQSEPPKLRSAEALIRWRHPELGLVPPMDFIPLFESTGQICEIDKYVWRETARQIAAWRDAYGVTVPVSVNLSRVDVLDPALEATLDGLVAEYALDRHALKLEVTESAYTENAGQLSRVIRTLRDKGHEIEMDDFGSGYSSLNMLSSMPIDILKMDRAFIKNIEHSEKDMRLVELILDIARNLQVPVVAEGVETEQQMLMLKRAGCALVQGYYFSRPLPAAEFERLIRE